MITDHRLHSVSVW